jgi:hypothetical protein
MKIYSKTNPVRHTISLNEKSSGPGARRFKIIRFLLTD